MSGQALLSGLTDGGFQRYQHWPVDNAVDSLSGPAKTPVPDPCLAASHEE